MNELAKKEFMELVRAENERKNETDILALSTCQNSETCGALIRQIEARKITIQACVDGTLFELEAKKSRAEREALQQKLAEEDERIVTERLHQELKAEFYRSPEWLDLRYRALTASRGRCELCGATNQLHVDHIKPRSKYPRLELALSNLQVLCRECNLGKSNKDETDWRR